MEKIEQEITGYRILNTPKAKSYLIIGEEKNIKFETDIKFNRFQKFMWKKCFNVKVEDAKE